MSSEGRGGDNFLRPYIILAFMAAVALPVTTWQGFYIHEAHAAIEVTPNSQTTNSFANAQLLYTLIGHTGTVKSLAFTPDSKILVSGGAENEGVIRLWNLAKGKKLANINKAHQTAIESLVISPDGQTLASCSDDNTINLWNLKNFKFTRSFVGHTSNVLSLAVSPDSKVLISGALDGIRIWDLLQQRPLGTLVRFDNLIYTLALSPDGQTLASGDNKGVIKLWNLSTGKLISEFVAHDNAVTSVVFTPDGQTLATASRDRTVKLWNINTGELVRTLTGHNNWVNAIAINPDGQTLASAGRDGIKLWNLTTGELINTLSEHTDWVSAIAFSPDGKILASGGFDKQIKIWGNPQNLINSARTK
ncbi:MAG: WD40 repeat domain-containing protein [Nostoc sp. ChiVER01]|nr:WD40 repeat domain-containing protein [Nostoc sp. ChiVER01]MDZ8224626.1 WD40 repeat domain-containing protein [Nostoc sp. ChiVER01]